MTASTPAWVLRYPNDYNQPADSPAALQQLAVDTDAALTRLQHLVPAGSVRLLRKDAVAIADSTPIKLTGGFTGASGDTGNGVLTYSAGILTATQTGFYDMSVFIMWATSGAGSRRVEVLVNGAVPFREDRLAASSQSGTVSNLAVTAVHLAAGGTLQLQVTQTSGANLNVSDGYWHVRKVAG